AAFSPRELRTRIDALRVDYPDLVTRFPISGEEWAELKALRLQREFDELAAGDVAGAKAIATRLRELEDAFPGHTGEQLTRIDDWVKRTEGFDAAFNAAKAKAARLLAANRGDEAFGVARTFAVEQFDEAQFLKR